MTCSVYVHVPFCDHICYYCGFFRQASHAEKRQAWLDKMCETARNTEFPDHLETLYFGGGTPSVLTLEELGRLRDCFPASVGEFTMEANPDGVTRKKAQTWHDLGINRISLGVQSFDDDMLAKIGRHHTAQQAEEAIEELKAAGISNLSIDLIYGLPGQTLDQVQADVERFLKLDIGHLSIYSLQIEENSVFGRQHIASCDEDLEADMYEWICARLKKAGYDHYEISSFARGDRHSRHNLVYWQDEDFKGLGPGAAGRENGQRYHIDEQWIRINEETDAPFEAIMMGLRTRFGIDLDAYETKYGINILDTYETVLERWKAYFRTDQRRLYLTEQGREVLNTILLDFMD